MYLVAGCAAAGGVFLAVGALVSDAALAAIDPRLRGRQEVPWLRRAGIAIVACVALVAVLAPALTPNQPGFRFPDRAYAPRCRSGSSTAAGDGARRFVYPIRLADRLERRFEEDRANPVPIAWFSRGVVAQVSDARQGPWLPLGADGSGRDVFARLVYGARLSLAVALAATLGAMLIGTLVGGAAGAAGGIVDEVLMRLSDFVIVLPANVRRALAAGGAPAGAASRPGVRAGGGHSRAGRLADRGARRAGDCRRRARARLRPGRPRPRRRGARGCCCATCCRRPAAFSRRRSRCW